MKNKKISVYDIVTERIVQFIEQNSELPWRKPWATVDNPQQNYLSNTKYKGINMLLTSMQGYSNPFWLTGLQVQTLGGMIKENEKPTPILYWTPKVKRTEDEDELDDEKKGKRFILRYYRVFNAEQIEGIAFPEMELLKQEFDPIDEAEKVIKDMPNCPRIKHEGSKAFYSPVFDSVTIPDTFFTAEEMYSTLFHEIAHSTGHPSRLNRFKEEGDDHKFGSQTYSKEELIAEMSSAFVLNTLGVANTNSDMNSAAYIKNWLGALRNDPRMIVYASRKAEKAADYIMNKEVRNVVGDK
jgi:antirestriction protein ArdC